MAKTIDTKLRIAYHISLYAKILRVRKGETGPVFPVDSTVEVSNTKDFTTDRYCSGSGIRRKSKYLVCSVSTKSTTTAQTDIYRRSGHVFSPR